MEYDLGLPQDLSIRMAQTKVFLLQITGYGKDAGCDATQTIDLLAQFSEALRATHQYPNGVTFRAQVRQQMLADEARPSRNKALHAHFSAPWHDEKTKCRLSTQLYSQAILSMNIGELEVRSGATRHTLRYYEKIGLISPLRRTNNYRVYTPQTLQDLDFIQRAQSMGFSLGEIGEILNAQRNKSIDCAGGARLIEKKMAEIRKKITDLKSIYRYLDAERANLEASAARQLELQQLNGSSS